MFVKIWLLVLLGSVKNSLALECYKCGDITGCKEKGIQIITCIRVPDVTTTKAPDVTTTKATTIRKTTTPIPKTIESHSEDNAASTTKEPESDEFADEVEPVSENAMEDSESSNSTELELLRVKRSAKGMEEDSWKCFTKKNEDGIVKEKGCLTASSECSSDNHCSECKTDRCNGAIGVSASIFAIGLVLAFSTVL